MGPGKNTNVNHALPFVGRRATALKLLMSVFLALLLLPLAIQGAQAEPGEVTLCSADSMGAFGNNLSFLSSVSADGRYVALTSTATNLVPGVTTGQHVYRKDLVTAEIELVSKDAANTPGNGINTSPVISDDGRYVAFVSTSTNLVTPVTIGTQVFRKDMVTGEVLLVSANAEGLQGDGISNIPSMSGDGRYLSFTSFATNLVTPGTTGQHSYRKDLSTEEIEFVETDASGERGDGISVYSSISPDGRYVAFSSSSTNLVTPDTTGMQIFRKDFASGEVLLVTADAEGQQGDANSGWPDVSGDGRYVSFVSLSNNLVPGVTGQQLYRKDLASEAIVLVSADAFGEQGDGASVVSSISADGRYVAFESSSTNLVTPDTTSQQIFRKDLLTAEVLLASADAAGEQGDDFSSTPSISADGRYVVFYSGASNLVPGDITIWQVYRKELATPFYFFFAEGYTGAGFQEYLCLGNPGTVGAFATITYMFPDGTTQEQEVELAADSRTTVDVNAAVGPDREVSAMIGCDMPFVAERPMYFSYQGQWSGGHDVVGAPAPDITWYFAEGYTGAGFDEWICVLNPGDLPAELTFRFQTQEIGEIVVEGFAVGPHTRASFKANDLLMGGSYQTSLALESDRPVVAERPMYFSYSGTGNWGWTGGHCVMGTTSLATRYFFAEGTTRAGFEEWITIQNPGDDTIEIFAEYVLAEGGIIDLAYDVGPGRRITIYVPNEIGAERDTSVGLASTSYFLAERPMYFDYQGLGAWGWTGGHCVIGATDSATDWFFAEGYTGAGFEEWLCILNGAAEAEVTITYYPEGGGTPIVRNHTVAPASRFTVPVNVDAGSDRAVSALVSSTVPVIVERPMYFDFRGTCPGGHDVVGFTQQ